MKDSGIKVATLDERRVFRRVFGCPWIYRLYILPLKPGHFRTWRIGRDATERHLDIGWNPHGFVDQYSRGVSVLLAWMDSLGWRAAVGRDAGSRRLYAFFESKHGRRWQIGPRHQPRPDRDA